MLIAFDDSEFSAGEARMYSLQINITKAIGLLTRNRAFHNTRVLANDLNPTVYALSTKMGRSAIGVVRISGSQCRHILRKLTRKDSVPVHRLATVRNLYSPQSGVQLDNALTLFFRGPNSYTGEDLLELHLHGGTAVIQAVLKAIRELHKPQKNIHIRYAEHGEFSRRGFTNGKYDLTEIEGIRELIEAETESQRLATLAAVDGSTSQLFRSWREKIAHNVALLTTVIDFGEDHDIEEVADLFDQVDRNISGLEASIREYLQRAEKSQVLLSGIKLSLLGPPNAGKSSLLNSLASRDAAIVSEIAGTTRDILDIPLDIAGYKTIIGDTAGIRPMEDADLIEREGIKRAMAASLTADIILLVLPMNKGLIEASFLDHIRQLFDLKKKVLVIFNKSDLGTDESNSHLMADLKRQLKIEPDFCHLISCSNGNGIDDLRSFLVAQFENISTVDPAIISTRTRDLLEHDVLQGFKDFQQWKLQEDVVLATESLRQSVDGIGKITGDTVGVEEILGIVFSSFCIGK